MLSPAEVLGVAVNEELSCPNAPMYDTVEQLKILTDLIIPSEQDENPQDASVILTFF